MEKAVQKEGSRGNESQDSQRAGGNVGPTSSQQGHNDGGGLASSTPVITNKSCVSTVPVPTMPDALFPLTPAGPTASTPGAPTPLPFESSTSSSAQCFEDELLNHQILLTSMLTDVKNQQENMLSNMSAMFNKFTSLETEMVELNKFFNGTNSLIWELSHNSQNVHPRHYCKGGGLD